VPNTSVNLLQPLFSVLPRSRASAMLLAAALVMASVATTLVAAVPLYSDAIVEAGLRSTLLDADPADSGFEAAFRTDAASWTTVERSLGRLVDDRLPGTRQEALLARSDTYQLPADRAEPGWITTMGVVRGDVFADTGPARRATPGVLAARVPTAAAELLGLEPGDRIALGRTGAEPVEVEIVAIVQPVDRFDKIWWDQPVFRDGVSANGTFTEIGPFFVDPASFAALGGTANVRWRVLPDPASISTDDIQALRRGVAGMATAIDDRLEVNSLVVDTGLPDLLATTDTAIGSTAAVIAAILLQLVGVALYGVGLSASVLVSSRAVETSMLRARGATPAQLGTMAAVEAILVAVPAVAVGPWAGSRVVELVERWGPVAQTELDLQPGLGTAAWLAAAVVGVAVIGIVTWPAVRSARGFARSQAARARPDAALPLQRTGLDIVVAALAIIGLWRLSASSAATSDLSGRLGTDPVLVLAPTLGVVAGSLLTLRLISLVASAVQRVTARRGALPMALAGWEIARRPGRTARTSVLIVLSVTVGTFAAVHGASWQKSLRDQADAAVSVDVLVTPDPRPAASLPQQYVADAYVQLDGVDEAIPVDRPTASVAAELSSVPVVLTDTVALGDALRLRDDLYGAVGSSDGYAVLHQPTDLGGVDLGEPTGDLVLDHRLTAAPASASGSIRLSATVLDRTGTPVHLDGDRIPVSDTGDGSVSGVVTFPLRNESVPGLSLGLDGPLRLVSIEVSFPSVQDVPFTDDPLPSGTFTLELGSARVGDRPVDLDGEWRVSSATLGDALTAPTHGLSPTGDGLRVRVDSGSTIRASASYGLTIDTGDFGDGVGAEIPVFATPGLLDATSLGVGDRLVARLNGATADLRIEGVIPVVPFDVREPVAFLADWETVSTDRFDRIRRFETPDAWAISTDEETAQGLERVLAGPPYDAAVFVERRQEARTISREPVTVGLSGSLALALAASLVVAAIGLVLTAVVGGRERRPAFAVLRAMGTRASELRRWLLFETVPLVGFSAVAGLVSGVALARLALPSLGVSRDGSSAVPSPQLVVPWGTLGIVVTIAVAAGMALPVVTARLLRRHRTADELRIGDST
jgi:hypothetical protein